MLGGSGLSLSWPRNPPSRAEYILVHEMVHFLERHHNDSFREDMGRVMPQWRLYRDALNQAPLAHEEWMYWRVWSGAPPPPVVPTASTKAINVPHDLVFRKGR